jgi:nitronate monooxygenase
VFLPLIAAPMTGVSGPELVAAACRAGVIGSFPTRNCGSVEELDEWLTSIEKETAKGPTAGSDVIAPVAANLIVHRTYGRRDDDIACLLDHGIDLVITSVGSPRPVVGPLHEGGVRVLADVASLAHAHKALADGVDGLVLLGAGAGGQTGWANPLAFVRAVRAFYDGPLVLAGGVSDGAALAAAVALGCDLAYMGTKFIATDESLASDAYKRGVVEGTMDDVSLGVSDIGIAASRLASGGSAGHTVSGVERVLPVEELVATTAAEWRAAWAGIRSLADAALAGAPTAV